MLSPPPACTCRGSCESNGHRATAKSGLECGYTRNPATFVTSVGITWETRRNWTSSGCGSSLGCPGIWGGLTATNYSNPAQMGRFYGFGPFDGALYLANSACQ